MGADAKLPKPSFKGSPPAPGPPVAPEGDAISVFGSQTVNLMGVSAVRMGDKSMSCGEPVRLPSSTVLAIPKGFDYVVRGTGVGDEHYFSREGFERGTCA